MNKVLARRLLLLLITMDIALLPGVEAAQPRLPRELLASTLADREPALRDDWLKRLVGRFRYEGQIDLQPGSISVDPDRFVPVTGIADCASVGTGSGVQCILNARWKEVWTARGQPITVPNLSPAMQLFGTDGPGNAVRYLQVDNKGIAEGGTGNISGDRTTFRAPCVNESRYEEAVDSAADAVSPGSAGVASSGAPGEPTDAPADARTGATMGTATAGNTVASWMSCQHITRIEAREGGALVWVWISFGDPFEPSHIFTLTLRRQKPADRSGTSR